MTQALPATPPEDAGPNLPPALPQSTVSEIASWLVGHTLDQIERELIQHTLQNCGGDRVLAASVLGISLPILRRKISAYAVRGQALSEPAARASENAVQVPQADNDPEPASADAVVVALQPEALAPAAVVALKPETPKKIDFRLWIGGALTAVLIGLVGFGLFGRKETTANFVLPERPRIDVSIVERPPPSQLRVAVPAWNGPTPPLPEPAEAADIAEGTPIESAATAEAATPASETIVPPDSGQDTISENAVVVTESAAGASPPAGDAFAGVNIEADTRMDAAVVSERADSAPETTASIDADAPIAAPKPLVRPAPPARAKAAPVQRQAARPRAAPARAAATLPAATPAQQRQPVFPFINIFAPKGVQPFAGGGPSTAAPGD